MSGGDVSATCDYIAMGDRSVKLQHFLRLAGNFANTENEARMQVLTCPASSSLFCHRQYADMQQEPVLITAAPMNSNVCC